MRKYAHETKTNIHASGLGYRRSLTGNGSPYLLGSAVMLMQRHAYCTPACICAQSHSDANETAGDDTLSVCSSFATQWLLGHFYLPTNSPLDNKRDATAFLGNLILIGTSFHH